MLKKKPTGIDTKPNTIVAGILNLRSVSDKEKLVLVISDKDEG